MSRASIAFVALLLNICGCVSKIHLDKSSQIESQGLVFSPQWLKRKGKAVDFKLQITNKSDGPIYIKRSSIAVKTPDVSEDMKNKSGVYAELNSSPQFVHARWRSIAENIEISPGSSFADLFIFHYGSKLPDSAALELVVSGIYQGTPEKTGKQLTTVRVPLTK